MHNVSTKNMQLRRLFIRAVLIFTVIWLSGSLFTVSSYADGEKGKKGNKADTTAETKNNNDGGNLANDKVVTGSEDMEKQANHKYCFSCRNSDDSRNNRNDSILLCIKIKKERGKYHEKLCKQISSRNGS